MDLTDDTRLLDRLDRIVERLDLLLLLSVPPFNPEVVKLGPTESYILDLCDLQHTTEEMVAILKKSRNAVDTTLSGLRKKRLVRSLRIGSRTVHARTGAHSSGRDLQ